MATVTHLNGAAIDAIGEARPAPGERRSRRPSAACSQATSAAAWRTLYYEVPAAMTDLTFARFAWSP
jgi:hypothetical protein